MFCFSLNECVARRDCTRIRRHASDYKWLDDGNECAMLCVLMAIVDDGFKTDVC